MANEAELRRPGFRCGISIRPADGHVWMISLPDELSDPHERKYRDALKAVFETQCSNEHNLAILVLLIYLLDKNYRMTPSAYRELLSFDPKDPRRDGFLDDIGRVANLHVQHWHSNRIA